MKKSILTILMLSTTVFASPSTQNQTTPATQSTENSQVKVVIYSSDQCSWCTSAKEILIERKIPFKEINVRGSKKLIDEMEQATGKRTVPQILINGKHIGSYLSLASANMTGELDELLNTTNKEEKP